MLCDFAVCASIPRVLQSFFTHSQMMQIIRGTSLLGGSAIPAKNFSFCGVLFMKSAGVIKRKIIGRQWFNVVLYSLCILSSHHVKT